MWAYMINLQLQQPSEFNLAYVPVADRHCGCPLHQHHLEQL